MGDNGIMQVAGRKSYYEDAIRNGSGAANTAAGPTRGPNAPTAFKNNICGSTPRIQTMYIGFL